MSDIDKKIYAWEGRLIIQIARVANVNAKLMKQLVHGRTDSEIVSSYMDLRNIANQIESIAEEGRRLDLVDKRG